MSRDSINSRARILAVIACAAFAASCGSTPSQPTPVDPGAPVLLCPAAPSATQASDSSGAVISFGAASASGGATPLTTPTCSPASGTKFPIGTTTVTCTVTDAKSRTTPCTLSVVVTPAPVPPRLPETATRFLAFGDSITWGEDGRNSDLRPSGSGQVRPAVRFGTADTYPGALETLLRIRYSAQTPTVANEGRSLEFAADSSTVARFVSLTSTGRYDVVLIMEGANDIGDRDSRIFPAVIANFQRMIVDAKSRKMKVMLATLTPENPKGDRGLGSTTVPLLNDQIRGLAAVENVTLVDIYQALNADVANYIGFDGLHPTALGYHKMADTFFAAIRSTLEVTPTTTASPSLDRLFAVPRHR